MASLFLALLLSAVCVHSSLAFPPARHALTKRPQPAEEREQVNTVRVTCHPDSLEVTVEADLFGVGAPVGAGELRLGVEHDDYCGAAASSGGEYKILVGLTECGTKHWMTDDDLVYTNLLIFSPAAAPDGLIRMDEAVIPIECHYERKYSLSSSSLAPTWIPFTSTEAAVETLDFDLRIMTDDWRYTRSSNVFFLGEPISVEASVRVGHHMGLRVFVSGCVATLDPDIYSVPRYVFVENGCLVDSELPGSRSHFLPRAQDDKLNMVIDAFRFHNQDQGQLYITCHLTAVPVHDAEAPNKACTLANGRWRSIDGNDFLCGHCQSQNEAVQTPVQPGGPGKFRPRGFGKPAEPNTSWRSGLKNNIVWEKEASVGPVLVLPARHKSGPLPDDELPPLLSKISRSGLYSSQWRGGVDRVDMKQSLLPGPSTPDLVEQREEEEEEDDDADRDAAEQVAPEVAVKSTTAAPNATAAPGDVGTSAPVQPDVTLPSNATVTQSDLSDTNDPKRK